MTSLAIDLKRNRTTVPWWRDCLNLSSALNQLEPADFVEYNGLKTTVRDGYTLTINLISYLKCMLSLGNLADPNGERPWLTVDSTL